MAENKMEQVDFWIRFFKEHINTIGCVELDGLDCREVLALLQELADKKVDKPNKMPKVARLFGKKLGEEFTIKRSFGFDFEGHFSEKGFEYWGEDTNGKCWYSDNGGLILELLTGRAVIVDD